MHKLQRGGKGMKGKGGGSKAPPPPSSQYSSLMSSAILFCQMVADEDEEANEVLDEPIQQFSQAKKQKIPMDHRIELLDNLANIVEDYMESLARVNEEKAEEIQLKEMLSEFYTATIQYMEFVYKIVEKKQRSKDEENVDQELIITLKLLDTLCGSTIQESAYNRAVFLSNYSDVIDFCLQAGGDLEMQEVIREASFGLLSNIVEMWPEGLVANDEMKAKIQQIVDASFKLCADPSDHKLDPSEFSSQNIATQLLDTICNGLKENEKAGVEKLIIEKAKTLLNEANTDENNKKAALVGLAVLPEASTNSVKSQLSELVELIIKQVSDTSPVVRAAAFLSLAEYIQHVQPEINTYINTVANLVLTILNKKDESELVQIKSAVPLIQACAHLEFKSVENVSDNNNIINQILTLLDTNRKLETISAGTADVMESLVASLEKFATGNKEAFQLYKDKIFNILIELMKDSSSQASIPAAQACNSLGEIAIVAGKADITGRLSTITPLLNENLKNKENYPLRTATFATWDCLATVLGSDIKPYVESTIPQLKIVLESRYPLDMPKKKGKAKIVQLNDKGEEVEEEEEEEEAEEDEENDEEDDEYDENNPDGIAMSEDKIDEQNAALTCYGRLIVSLGPDFIQYNDELFPVLFESGNEYSEEGKRGVASLLALFPKLYPVQRSNDAKPNPVERDRNKAWTVGENLTMPSAALDLMNKAKRILLAYINSSSDPEVVRLSLDALTTIILAYGQIMTQDEKKTETSTINLVKKILKDKISCQLGYGDDEFGGLFPEEEEEEEEEEEPEEEEEEEGEEAEKDENKNEERGDNNEDDDLDSLKTASLDCLCALARVRGKLFSEKFSELFPLLMKSTKVEELYGYSFGCFPDFQDALGPSDFTPYAKQILPAAIKKLENLKDAAVGRNITYCIGSLLLKGGQDLASVYESAATNLCSFTKELQQQVKKVEAKAEEKKQTEKSETEIDLLASLDNSVSAIGKLLMVGADKLAEASRNQCVELFSTNLPLKADFDECTYAYSATIKLATTQSTAIKPYAKHLINVFYTLLQAPMEEKESQNDQSEIKNQFRLTDKLKMFIVKGCQGLLNSEATKSEVEAAMNEWPAEKKEKFLAQTKA